MIVLDTSVLSAFSEIEKFPLLKEILDRLGLKAIIPDTVEKEIMFPEAESAMKRNGGWIDIEKTHGFEKDLITLHDGESGVIALAKEQGFDDPATKAGAIVAWLKKDFDLGHGHAMALVHVIKHGAQISDKHVDSGGAHSDSSNTLKLDGKDES